jgi:hypothetical protein
MKPQHWYKAITFSGKDAGLGFFCPTCKLCYPHSCGEEVFHCGAIERLDKGFFERLPEVKLGQKPVTLLE